MSVSPFSRCSSTRGLLNAVPHVSKTPQAGPCNDLDLNLNVINNNNNTIIISMQYFNILNLMSFHHHLSSLSSPVLSYLVIYICVIQSFIYIWHLNSSALQVQYIDVTLRKLLLIVAQVAVKWTAVSVFLHTPRDCTECQCEHPSGHWPGHMYTRLNTAK